MAEASHHVISHLLVDQPRLLMATLGSKKTLNECTFPKHQYFLRSLLMFSGPKQVTWPSPELGVEKQTPPLNGQSCTVTLRKDIHTSMGRICGHFCNLIQVSLHRYLYLVYETFISVTWMMLLNLKCSFQQNGFNPILVPRVLMSNQFLPEESVGILALMLSRGVLFTGEAAYFRGCPVIQPLKVRTDVITSQD